MRRERKLEEQGVKIMIKIRTKGNYDDTEKFLKNNKDAKRLRKIMEKYGREGVSALSAMTPINTGETASSWTYEIVEDSDSISLVFNNSETTVTGIPIIILLQYGHGNGRGGYVQGRDIVNPAIQPIFDKLAEEAWREVSK